MYSLFYTTAFFIFRLSLTLWDSFLERVADSGTTPIVTFPDVPVDLFIGTTGSGHVFPGACVPHGMVKVGMDTDSRDNQAGYDADPRYKVLGFSQLHDDGTGDHTPLSNFKIFPSPSCSSFESCATSIDKRRVLRNIRPDGTPDDAASPGYFSTNLSSGVRVELTATRRTSLQRYTFSPQPQGYLPRINVDIDNDGQRSAYNPTVTIDPETGRVTGGATFRGSFAAYGTYKAFTCVDFRVLSPSGAISTSSRPAEYGVWAYNGPVMGTTSQDEVNPIYIDGVGALLGFEPHGQNATTAILVRTGVSFISTQQACENAEQEIPFFDFDNVKESARQQWNELLGRVQVTTADGQEDTRVLFYSSLYRTHLSPADYTDENPLWNSTEPYYDSFYCNWDTYRTMFPLLAMHDPIRYAQIVRGMIDIQVHEGWLPECRGATVQQYVQGGSNGDPIVAEFAIKFPEYAAQLNVSLDKLYTALLADAEDESDKFDFQGRMTTLWKQYGYLPKDGFTAGRYPAARGVSRALEYAFDDFTIYQVAKLLNKTEDIKKYASRAANFVNNWNPNVTMPGGPSSILGMMQPRTIDGSFVYTDPRICSPFAPPGSRSCFLDAYDTTGFYEGSPLLYSQYVPHDTARLIKLQGGEASFISRLDFIIDNGYFDVTDEPGQQIPFMYHYANRPGLSTLRTRQTISSFYNTSVNGLPGNDDSGAMGSFAVFLLAGLYPLPATRQLLLSSPHFPSISFHNPLTDSTATIRVTNFDASSNNTNIFVKNVQIDGNPWHSRCYIDWDVFEKGSTVELELTTDATLSCGDSPAALPPSLSTGGY